MSVKLIDNNAFHGYRARRTVGGKIQQIYFSLMKGGKRVTGTSAKIVKAAATKKDDELKVLQAQWKKDNKANRCFRADGTVKGISYLRKAEKSGNLTPIFQVGCSSAISEREIITTSFSVQAHGVDKAWKMAVDCLCMHRAIRKNTKLYKKILATMPVDDMAAKNAVKGKTKPKSTVQGRPKNKPKPKAKAKPKAYVPKKRK